MVQVGHEVRVALVSKRGRTISVDDFWRREEKEFR
jgi:hypothetical protein